MILPMELSNAVTSSGDISLIENDQLKYTLSSLSGFLNDYQHWAEVDYDNIQIYIAPFLMRNYTWRSLPLFAKLGQSKFEVDPIILARSSEFESHVAVRWVNVEGLKTVANILYEEQTKLIKLIEAEIARLEGQ